MRNVIRWAGRFIRQEDGTETVEWGIMAGLIVTGLIGVVAAIGTWVYTRMNNAKTNLGTP